MDSGDWRLSSIVGSHGLIISLQNNKVIFITQHIYIATLLVSLRKAIHAHANTYVLKLMLVIKQNLCYHITGWQLPANMLGSQVALSPCYHAKLCKMCVKIVYQFHANVYVTVSRL